MLKIKCASANKSWPPVQWVSPKRDTGRILYSNRKPLFPLRDLCHNNIKSQTEIETICKFCEEISSGPSPLPKRTSAAHPHHNFAVETHRGAILWAALQATNTNEYVWTCAIWIHDGNGLRREEHRDCAWILPEYVNVRHMQTETGAHVNERTNERKQASRQRWSCIGRVLEVVKNTLYVDRIPL